MKRRILSLFLALLMSVSTGVFMTACDTEKEGNVQIPSGSEENNVPGENNSGENNSGENNSGDTGNETPAAPTLEEVQAALKAEDKNYDRAIYLAPGDTYAYEKQLEYEEKSVAGITYECTAESFTVAKGVITAGAQGEGVTSEELTVKAGELTEKVVVHVVNREKYGDIFFKIDVGMLYGKKVIFFGDSITHNWAKYPSGNDTPVNNTNSLGYNHIPMLNDICRFSGIINAAWSGGTVAYMPTSSERFTYKSFPGAVDAHKSELAGVDYAFILYGTNDWTEQVPIGEESDTMTADERTDSTFFAGLNYGLAGIRAANAQTKIVVMSILTRDPPPGKLKITHYNNALKAGAEKYQAKLLNTNKLFTTADLNTVTNDGLHPNETGYRLLTEYILGAK